MNNKVYYDTQLNTLVIVTKLYRRDIGYFYRYDSNGPFAFNHMESPTKINITYGKRFKFLSKF